MKIVKNMLERASKMTVADWIVFKLCLVVFGVIIGAYVSTTVINNIWYFAGVFVVLYIVLLVRLFQK